MENQVKYEIKDVRLATGPACGSEDNRDIVFWVDSNKEILRLAENGDIFVKGKLIENDEEVVDAIREFIARI